MTTHEIDLDAPRAPVVPPPPPPPSLGVLAGLVAGAVAVTSGMLVAAIIDVASPLDDVGSSFIDRTPKWLKDFAIEQFGTNDKTALRVGMVIVLAIAAAGFGVLALRRRWLGVAGIAAFGVIGMLSAAERPDQPDRAVIPPLLGAALGAAVLLWLVAGLVGHWVESLSPGRSRVRDSWDRRRFLTATGGLAAAAVVAGGTARALERRRVQDLVDAAPDTLPPIADAAVPEAPADDGLVPGTPFITPNDDFYRIDTALSFPRIDLDRWTVRVHGMVDREVTITYEQLLAMPMVERMVTLACVSNEVGGDLVGNAVWQGVLLADVLAEAGVQDGAEQVFSRSVDGFTCGFPVAAALDGRDCLIAIGMNGEALPLAHGFPARLVVPGLYGYVSATKWLKEIELTTWDAEQGYWVPRGWSRDAPIKTQSRIDVPRRGDDLEAGRIAVAGVAWAPNRGVAKVEVRVDDGPWQEARLGEDASDDAWRQWVYEWEATSGEHRLQVRATDATGETQTEEVAPPAPNGATGYHTRRVNIR
jgi:DMSO/TMAO reductase YedYZ molybdopterin-dependent catalytic subunit